jgi:hypothetical protein
MNSTEIKNTLNNLLADLDTEGPKPTFRSKVIGLATAEALTSE